MQIRFQLSLFANRFFIINYVTLIMAQDAPKRRFLSLILKHNPLLNPEKKVCLHISANLEMIKLLMTQHFTRFYPVAARSALLFHLSTPITTTLPLTLLLYFSQFRPTNTLRTPLVLQTGPKSTNIAMDRYNVFLGCLLTIYKCATLTQ